MSDEYEYSEYRMYKETNSMTNQTQWFVERGYPWEESYGPYRWRWLARRKLTMLLVADSWEETK